MICGYLKSGYERIRENYKTYRNCSNSGHKKSRFVAFFKAVLNYILKRPNPILLSGEERARFESGLDRKIISNFDVYYAPGEIVLRSKDLTSRLS